MRKYYLNPTTQKHMRFNVKTAPEGPVEHFRDVTKMAFTTINNFLSTTTAQINACRMRMTYFTKRELHDVNHDSHQYLGSPSADVRLTFRDKHHRKRHQEDVHQAT